MGVAGALACGFGIIAFLEIKRQQYPQAVICLLFGTVAAAIALF